MLPTSALLPRTSFWSFTCLRSFSSALPPSPAAGRGGHGVWHASWWARHNAVMTSVPQQRLCTVSASASHVGGSRTARFEAALHRRAAGGTKQGSPLLSHWLQARPVLAYSRAPSTRAAPACHAAPLAEATWPPLACVPHLRPVVLVVLVPAANHHARCKLRQAGRDGGRAELRRGVAPDRGGSVLCAVTRSPPTLQDVMRQRPRENAGARQAAKLSVMGPSGGK